MTFASIGLKKPFLDLFDYNLGHYEIAMRITPLEGGPETGRVPQLAEVMGLRRRPTATLFDSVSEGSEWMAFDDFLRDFLPPECAEKYVGGYERLNSEQKAIIKEMVSLRYAVIGMSFADTVHTEVLIPAYGERSNRINWH